MHGNNTTRDNDVPVYTNKPRVYGAHSVATSPPEQRETIMTNDNRISCKIHKKQINVLMSIYSHCPTVNQALTEHLLKSLPVNALDAKAVHDHSKDHTKGESQ
jgi:hypothetical protein